MNLMVTKEARELLLRIARCDLVSKQLTDPGFRSPCSALIEVQSPLDIASHQVPEPWSGRLESAHVLFIGSNPSINPIEVSPLESWENEEIVDYYHNRFGGGKTEWVKQLRVLRRDGSYEEPAKWVRFWAACRGRASEVLGRKAVDGIDYAITEAVHCKSKGEKVSMQAVTALAATTCADRYLRAIIQISSAKVVISFGGIAEVQLRRVLDLGPERVCKYAGRSVLFLDHPAGFGSYKKLSSIMSAEELRRIQIAV